MKTDLDKLNEQASESFERAKKKLGFVTTATNILQNKNHTNPSELQIKFDKLMHRVEKDEEIKVEDIEITDEQSEVINVLSFLDSLTISNDLKLSISHIIASGDKDKVKNLQKAISYINKELE